MIWRIPVCDGNKSLRRFNEKRTERRRTTSIPFRLIFTLIFSKVHNFHASNMRQEIYYHDNKSNNVKNTRIHRHTHKNLWGITGRAANKPFSQNRIPSQIPLHLHLFESSEFSQRNCDLSNEKVTHEWWMTVNTKHILWFSVWNKPVLPQPVTTASNKSPNMVHVQEFECFLEHVSGATSYAQ